MNLEVLEQDKQTLTFLVEGISIEMANAIRRTILSEIPVIAIDEVIILKNDTPLYDEIVAHRLGLIPLTTDLETYNLPYECECEGYGCPLCQVSLTCEFTNTTNSPVVIYSRDLKSNDPKIVPVSPDIPIVKVDKNDSVIFEAYAILGTAKDHVKWQAVSNILYRYLPEITVDEKKCENCLNKCEAAEMCPQKLYIISESETPKLIEDYWKECTLCNACSENCENSAININWKKNSFIFSIESDGVLPFDVLIRKAFEIFVEKIDEFETKLITLDILEELPSKNY